MGADMTLHCAPACDLTPQRVKRIKQVVRAIPKDDVDLQELMQCLGYDDPAEAKRQIVKDGLESQYEDREITNLHIPGCPYVVRVAGGLSWGDPPSEACAVECAQMRVLIHRHAEDRRECEFGWGAYRKHSDVWVTTPSFTLVYLEEMLAKAAVA